MRYPSVPAIPGVPPVLIKPIAKPGTYQVRLTVNGEVQTQSFELNMNPNETYTRAETDAKGEFWMQLYAKAEEGVQAVLDAQTAQAAVADTLESDSASDDLKAQAQAVHDLSQEFIAGMVATGRTLVQIISEPTKPLSKLVTLHNVMETSEGPPNQPLREVYELTAAEIDAAIAEFRSSLDAEMATFDAMMSN
jgi:2,4-dienoyl-CoA reductase-like NADH-dependent reductase (Old Yellow Enzyme family)